MDWKKSIFILLYLPAIIQGVVHFIKNDIMNKSGICYTDSEYNNGPTMAFLRNVKKGCPKPTDETLIANGLINDCNLVSANGCGNWKTNQSDHYELKTNLVDGDWFDEFEPVLDHRWNSFKEIVTCGGGDFTNWTRMRTNNSQGRFHYSVFADHSAIISLSKHENLKNQPGFQIVLDGWENHHMSCIRYCTNLLNSKTCTILSEKVNENIFNGGNAWATATVEYEMDPPNAPTTLKKLSVSVMNKNWKLECSGNNSHEIFNFVAFKTHQDVGYFRIHKYNYIEKGQSETKFTSEIKQEQTAAAISLTYYAYYLKNKTRSDTIYAHTLSDISNPWQSTKLPTNAVGKWQTATILLVNQTNKIASLFFRLHEFEKVCIGHISLLSSEPFGHGLMISSRVKNLLSCTYLDQINTISTNKTSELKVEKLVLKSAKDREIICQEMGNDDCSNTEACGINGCFCISGFNRGGARKCVEKCIGKQYGPNCDLLSEVNCPGENFNVHTGKCGLCEQHGFHPPDCANPCRDRSYGSDCAFQLPQKRSCNGDYNKITGLCSFGCLFSGQQPPYCDRDCDDGKFGVNCTQDQPFGKCKGSGSYGNYNKDNGNCIKGCARAFQPPQCSKECDDGAFGINCEERRQKGCSGPGDYGEYNKTTGQCLKGCKFIGKQPPFCNSECNDGKFGENCKQEQQSGKCRGYGPFGNYNKTNGNCIEGCSKAGLKTPQCIDECEYGDFGSNCEEKRLKNSCSGSGEYGEYNKTTGQCLNGCKQNGKQPPICNTSCTNGTFGPNCSKQLKSGKCSGQGNYGDYDSATGSCKSGCAKEGFEFPLCEQECRNGKYGQNCKNQLKQNVCAGQDPYGDYSKSNGDCKSCKFKGKKPSKCEHDCDKGYFGQDCKQNQPEKCSGHYHRDIGYCKTSCVKSGLKFPVCEKPCGDGKFGLNCFGDIRIGKCAGPTPYGAYNKETGNCTQGCAKPGFYPPACVSQCINGSFGFNCSKKLSEKKCVGNLEFGNYNSSTGECIGNCLNSGVEHPGCEKECQNGSYGQHCLSKLSPNSCAEQGVGNYDKKTGDCKKCARLGFKLPTCIDPCEEGKFGQDCQRTLTKLNKCSGSGNFGNYSRDSGNCNFSCKEPGFQYPWCENECEEGTFGQHCQQKLKEGKCSGDGKFGNYSRDSGNCSVSCQEPGLEFPWCEKECDGGKFGNHCEEQLNEKKCSGGGNYGNYSKVNGQCRETCEKPGLQFPDCEEECRDGKFGINCNEEPGEVQGRCSGEGEFGGYDKATGHCKQGCRFIGMQPPMCTSECKKGQYGLNCKEKLDPSNCVDELYNVTNAHCLKGCAREGLIVPNCQEGAIEENNGIIYYFLIGILVIVILFLIIVLRKKFLLCKLLSRNLESEPEYAIPLEVMVKSKITMNDQTSLKNFGNTVTIKEYADYFATELQSENLCEQFRASPRGQIMPVNIGSSEENKKKNRDGVIPAYDETRVCLQTKIIEGKKNAKNGYINANHVRVLGNKYVATQGPLEQTVKDFWRMVWQEKATMIVMLANLTENGEVKCAKYWPEIFEVVTIGSLEIRNIDEIVSLDFFKRTLSVTNGSINRKITQMHYTVWPDHGIPFNAQSTAIFVENVLKISMDAPMIVHCSSGEGRTGAYIMIDACLRMAKSQGHLNPCGAFKEMRRHRANLVETEPQYIFAHFVLYEALCIPKLAIPCKKFKVELGKLLQNGHELLKIQLHQLNEICAKDWSRMEIRDSDRIPEKCRKPELQALPLRYVRLVPEDVFCCQNTFINAVYVDGYKRKNAFITTQVPLSDTVSDFWLMVYQQRVKSVIVLNEAVPNEPIFLPCNASSPLTGVGFSVGLQSKAVKNNYQTLTVDIKKGYDNWVVEVVCFVGWPAEFLTVPKLSKLVKLCEDEEFNLHDAPTVLICHDGVTACGALVALSIILEKIKMEHDVDVASAVRAVRSVRPDFVSKLEQFEMLYRCALEYILSFATYRNLD